MYLILMPIARAKVHCSDSVTDTLERVFIHRRGVANGAIIVPLRPSPGLDAGCACPHQKVESRCGWVDFAEVAYDTN